MTMLTASDPARRHKRRARTARSAPEQWPPAVFGHWRSALCVFRLRVTAAFLAAADRLAAVLAADAAPPILPPLCAAGGPSLSLVPIRPPSCRRRRPC